MEDAEDAAMADELIIRPARGEDRAAVERICANTWDWGDYVPQVWDEWLADERGVLQVGEIGGEVVAVNKITFHAPDQAWLEGMRVDPERRREGIGWQFMQHDLAYVRDHGARVVRLATGSHNAAVHAMMERAGLARVGVCILLVAAAAPDGALPAILAPEQQPLVASFLERSPMLAHMHGLYDSVWAWQALSGAHVAEMLAAGQLAARLGPSGEIEALAVALLSREDERVWVGLADGRPAEVTALAAGLRAHAARLGAKQVEAMLPDVEWLRDAFRQAGYEQGEWKGELWIFEKWFAGP